MFSLKSPSLARPLIATAVVTTGAYACHAYLSTHPLHADSGRKEPPKTFAGGWFKDLKLQSVEQVNHNTKRLRFQLPEEDAISGLPLASAVLSKHTPKGKWLPVIRPYTPISKSDEQGHIDFLIKHYPDGKASGHMHSLTPGQTMSFKGPIPTYKWDANAHSHLVLIAGGMGITPMYQLVCGILDNPVDKTKITLIYGTNTDEDVHLKKDFDKYQKKFPNRLDVHYTVSQPSKSSPYRKGYITKELLKEVMPGPEQGEKIKVVFCGPPAMEEAVIGKGSMVYQTAPGGILKELGYSKEQLLRLG
ncbi:MAG: hypothetical protein M1834_005338 [Cirrosporium novae-zelandiae]|nr:MAG: hypothetical protein M1834_005338 [Cirrosporium novae-zelandiae]